MNPGAQENQLMVKRLTLNRNQRSITIGIMTFQGVCIGIIEIIGG